MPLRITHAFACVTISVALQLVFFTGCGANIDVQNASKNHTSDKTPDDQANSILIMSRNGVLLDRMLPCAVLVEVHGHEYSVCLPRQIDFANPEADVQVESLRTGHLSKSDFMRIVAEFEFAFQPHDARPSANPYAGSLPGDALYAVELAYTDVDNIQNNRKYEWLSSDSRSDIFIAAFNNAYEQMKIIAQNE